MSEQAKVALVTCREFPNLDAYDAVLVPRLKMMGVDAVPAIWDDPAVDWDAFDMSVVRSTWDYASRRDEYIAWAKSVPRLVNSAQALEWNTDKHYLRDLHDRGVRVVSTMWLEPGQPVSARWLHTRFPASGDFVLKPAIAAGSIGAGRYTANDPYLRGRAIAHARTLLSEGHSVMVQRYIPSVDKVGEVSMVFLEGRYAYAVQKGAMLHGPEGESGRGYQAETLLGGYTPTAKERDIAERTVEAALDALGQPVKPFLYARADLVQAEDGEPVLLEFEVAEPSLFPELATGGIDMVCRAIAGRLSPA